MTKPLVLALALALAAPGVALAAPATPAAKTAPKPAPAWVAKSNQYAQILLKAQAPFQPEQLSFFGVPGFDDKVFDFGPDYQARFRAATARARDELRAKLATETDPNVRQDIEILIQAADDAIEGSEVGERMTRPWLDVGQTVFGGLQGLLSDQTAPERRAMAVKRLQAYVGQAPGSTPLATLARQRYEERAQAGLLQPTQIEVQQSLDNLDTYRSGIKDLFAKYKVEAGPALAELDRQLADYAVWTKSTVLPTARTTYALPPELYTLALKGVGIDIDPRTLIERAQLEFAETRNAMQQIAPLVAKAHGWSDTDYVAVIRQLKKTPIPNDKIESHYRTVVMPELDRLIAANKVVELPNRPMQMRVGTPAESAAQPAPHFLPAPLVGNTGQQGTFVLPLSNPNAGADGPYDDFNYPAGAWTLSAHEGRPGHELQFTAMVERGISLARTLYAFNSVNVEGWALYAEAEMVPYEPLDGQLIALQLRLLRASRAMLDPMLNLGLTDRDTAFAWLVDKVGLSKAMARQEVDRYTVRSPGQAGSYFHGYSQIMQLRTETEIALGDRFDRKAFNDFLLDQGLLPPKLLAKAVREQFVPQQKAKKG
ncbi:hypothetical protein GCM10008101_22190 [Lysobacter xinjiangensis]|uniref:DUF885 domain-containing protein n=1 Tax=Cognatilysobacter xinjiangensis TaxID=546892 RepID=A0ABQ3C8I4_9GAMM|nr:DUF885 domain-containing protein [Lysobacter xinjiangensis]GGZ67498.1 hypothetical protein GCM10008101_22190 [Lysobacter xinjiangensis]